MTEKKNFFTLPDEDRQQMRLELFVAPPDDKKDDDKTTTETTATKNAQETSQLNRGPVQGFVSHPIEARLIVPEHLQRKEEEETKDNAEATKADEKDQEKQQENEKEDDAEEEFAPVVVISQIRWELLLRGPTIGSGRWVPVPEYARPFPWNPHTFTPPADLVGMTLRAVACAKNDNDDQPLRHPRHLPNAPLPPPPLPPIQSFVSQQVAIVTPHPKAALAVAHVKRTGKFGFLCVAAHSDQALVVTAAASHSAFAAETEKNEKESSSSTKSLSERSLTIEAKIVPTENDKAPMETVYRQRLVFAAAAQNGDKEAQSVKKMKDAEEDALAGFCALALKDEVSLSLQVPEAKTTDSDVPTADSVLDRDAMKKMTNENDKANENVGDNTTQHHLRAALRRRLDVCVRTRENRDMITLCLRGLAQAVAIGAVGTEKSPKKE